MLRLLIVMSLAVAVFGVAIDPSSVQSTPLGDVPIASDAMKTPGTVDPEGRIMNVRPTAEPSFYSQIFSTGENSWISKVATALGPVPRFALQVARNIFDNSYWTIAAVALSFVITSGVCYLTPFCTLSTPYFNVDKSVEAQFDKVFTKYFAAFSPYTNPETEKSSTNVNVDDQEKRAPVYEQPAN